jgi:hypothetical protein
VRLAAAKLEVPRIERPGVQAPPPPGMSPIDQPLSQLPGPHPDICLDFGILPGELCSKPDFAL